MATSDLLAELSKETFKPDSDGERKICKCVLKLLNDQSSDVKGLAVKWCVPRPPPAQGTSESLAHSALAPPASLTAARPAAAQPFAARAQGARAAGGGDHGHAGDAGAGRTTSAYAMHRGVECARRTLRCAMQVLTGKEEQRDICSIGLKTVVLEMPQIMAVTAVRQLAPKLVSGMAADVNMAPALVGDSAPSARPASHRARSAASATLRAQLPGSQPALSAPYEITRLPL